MRYTSASLNRRTRGAMLKPLLYILVCSCCTAFSPQAFVASFQTSLQSSLPNEVQSPVATRQVPPPPPPPKQIQSLSNFDAFFQYIDDAPKDSLAVIKFYSNSCPLCKRIELRYRKLARFYATAPLQLAEMARTPTNGGHFDALNVQTFPYIQIYRNGQCVAAHGIADEKTFEPALHDTLQHELVMSPADWDRFLTAFAEPIQQSTERLEKLRQSLATTSS